jgi:putative hydrolase of the HAD superfamily
MNKAAMFYVFDLDDTLYLERNFVRSGFQVVGQWMKMQFSVDDFFARAWKLFELGHRRHIFDRVVSELDIGNNRIVEEMVAVYRTHEPAISLEPDAILFLESHAANDMAIITDGHAEAQRAKIRSLRLDRLVGRVIATDDWGRDFWKPHPRSFIDICQGRDPADCVYIADNPSKDFMAPEQLGWAPSIRIRRPEALHSALMTPAGCKEITSLSEIGHLE